MRAIARRQSNQGLWANDVRYSSLFHRRLPLLPVFDRQLYRDARDDGIFYALCGLSRGDAVSALARGWVKRICVMRLPARRKILK